MNNIAGRMWKRLMWPVFYRKYVKKVRRRLNNDHFTIISQNCVGGVIYNSLGKRFDSPTINLYIYQSDFCKFCSDLHYYMGCELRFYKNNEDSSCPYAFLGSGEKEISIQFTHYKSKQEASEKWNERKKRIHWDNIYIITNDGNGVTDVELNSLQNVGCKRVVVFTSKHKPNIIGSFQLKSLLKYDTAVFMQTERDKITGLRPWQKEFDVVAWLNETDDRQPLSQYRI